MAQFSNQSFLDLELCDSAVSVESNEVVTDIIDLTIEKEADCNMAVIGGTICYTVTIKNNSDIELETIFRDPLASNLVYVQDSFTVDGEPQTPTYDAASHVLSYPLTLDPHCEVVIRFCVKVYAPTNDLNDEDSSDVSGDTV